MEWDGLARSPQAIAKLINKLKKDGYKIFAIEQDKKSVPYFKIKNTAMRGSVKNHNVKISNTITRDSIGKIALVVGSEVKGLPLSILKRSDKILEIPMKGKKESLNVGVAFGIVAFHLINS